jgi:iron-sulfur cluster assembly protein
LKTTKETRALISPRYFHGRHSDQNQPHKHVNRYLAKRGKGLGVRLGVKTTGCSGLAYKLEYVDASEPEDVIFEDHGVKVLVDPKSLAYIDGTQLDFVREGLNEGFKFSNPNERDRCGCGESFRI